MRRVIVALFSCACSVGAFGGTLDLQFPGNGPWTVHLKEGEKTLESKTVTGLGEKVTFSKESPEAWVVVVDSTSGLCAKKTWSKIGGKWHIQMSEFAEIYKTQLYTTYLNQPVLSGTVNLLVNGKVVASKSFTAESKGLVTFDLLKPVRTVVQVTGLPRLEENSPAMTEQIIDLKEQAATGRPIQISIAYPVSTVAPPKPKEPIKAATEKPSASAGPPLITKIFPILLGIGACIGAAWFMLRYLKDNPEKINEGLKQVGLKLPTEGEEADTPPPPVIPADEPAQTIILPEAEPVTSLGIALLLANGSHLPLDEGTHLVSREPGASISFAGETSISRQHAEVIVQGTSVSVNDLGSTNGTYVNGEKISSSVLKVGDIVQFGEVTARVVAR